MYEVEATGGLLLMVEQDPREATTSPVRERGAHVSLVESVQAGDREAFGQLYKLYAPMVHGILLARVPFDEVADLVQDVFLLAFKKLHTLRDNAAFGGWLAMITRNHAMNFHRRTHASEELTEDMARTDSRASEAREVLAIIRSLPDAYRETLILRLVEGMTGPEIAERTGLMPDSVRVNLHRGMKLLREKLRGEERI
ncbi:MAG TPA: sigma-70 family RNA polymerase sigma factor [Pyrinomonadaceae bacterium]|jgi:RNA polymerase sigma-70 factor (ECF subfamily)|nr:sigma-70 family RNA polymerase sigma factor [Pyrinomonadaceae bacterium]